LSSRVEEERAYEEVGDGRGGGGGKKIGQEGSEDRICGRKETGVELWDNGGLRYKDGEGLRGGLTRRKNKMGN